MAATELLPCPQCGGHVVPAEGMFSGVFSGHGRCLRCAVVLRWGLGGWRLLSSSEWQHAPTGLAAMRPWLHAGWH